MKTLATETKNWVQTIKLNRPKLNAMNSDFFSEIKSCFNEIKHDGSVRVVVLFSNFENVFTAGLDCNIRLS